MNKTISPLRYPGGKTQFYNRVLKIIETNNLLNCIYIEPFAGGAGVALKLLFENKVKKIIINDLDKSIYAFWYTVLNYNDWFCQKIFKTPVNIVEYRKQKEIQKNSSNVDLKELGFSTFYLNRTNRSGIINAGPIGGLKQDGNWKIDCRFNKQKLIKKIQLIKILSKKIKLYNLDTVELIKKFRFNKNQKYFLFFDPPYYAQGKELYSNFFNHSDHVKLAEIINKKLENKYWIVTYDISDQILKIYNENSFIEFSLNYSVEKKRKAKEYMFYKNLSIPHFI